MTKHTIKTLNKVKEKIKKAETILLNARSPEWRRIEDCAAELSTIEPLINTILK